MRVEPRNPSSKNLVKLADSLSGHFDSYSFDLTEGKITTYRIEWRNGIPSIFKMVVDLYKQ